MVDIRLFIKQGWECNSVVVPLSYRSETLGLIAPHNSLSFLLSSPPHLLQPKTKSRSGAVGATGGSFSMERLQPLLQGHLGKDVRQEVVYRE